jgi:hypothetical protein
MFTARYALSPYVKQMGFVFEGLTFQSLAETLHTTRFNIKKFYMVPTLRFCVLYGSQNKQ